MIFIQLFLTFLLIGAFTFGGGYSMIALIQGEVVDHRHWMTLAEFTDLVAVSQMTPGPVGINTATYAGYTAVANSYGVGDPMGATAVGIGDPMGATAVGIWMAVGGSLLASLAVIAVPVVLTLVVSRWLLAHKDNPHLVVVVRVLRLVVVGLIAAAVLQLMPTALQAPILQFSLLDFHFSLFNLLIFAAVFILSWRYKKSPVFLIVASGLVGLIVYSL